MFLPLTVWAERYIIVNGQRLNDGQIELLERVHGGLIANGNYWLDTMSGLWGYAGNPQPMGYIWQTGPRPSLSKRGQLFRPGELAGVEVIY